MLPQSFLDRFQPSIGRWVTGGASMDRLLVLQATYDNPRPPGWLELCTLLAQPALGQPRNPAVAAADPHWNWLLRLRQDMVDFAGCPGNPPRWFTDNDSVWAARARAMALSACGLLPADNVTWLSPLERQLLADWTSPTGQRPTSAGTLQMVVLLINREAGGNEAGRLAWLQLWRLDGEPALGECLVRAPQAQALALDAEFQAGLQKVQRLLQAAVSADAPAVAWALQPLPMLADGNGAPLEWGTLEIGGPSISVALAVGSLYLLRHHLLPACGGRWLHRVHPQALAITAQFDGSRPPEGDPLQWPLKEVGGVTDKLHAFGEHMSHPGSRTNIQHPTAQVWVAKGTQWQGDRVRPKEACTLRQLLEEATAGQSDRLPDATEALLQAVLKADGDAVDQLALLQPTAEIPTKLPELDDDLVKAQRKAPYQPLPPQTHAALEQHLLRRLAQWTVGDHLQFQHGGGPVNIVGAPVRLRDEFCPIAIDRSHHHPKAQALRSVGASEDDIGQAFQAQSLQHLLHNPDFGLPVAWVLRADPAAGKTTLLAEHELRACWRALHRFARHGQWGEVALWVPLRQLKPLGRDGRRRDASEVLGEWVATHAPAFSASTRAADAVNAGNAAIDHIPSEPVWAHHWQAVFEGPLVHQAGLRVRVLLDGVNELSCSPDQRQTLLQQLLDGTWQSGRTDRLTPVFTVRTLERSFSLLGQGLADLLPWDEPRRNAYIDERLGADSAQAEQLKAAIAQDPETQDARKFYANPGMLALVCNLLQRGWINTPTSNRAQLFACTLWMRLYDEQARTQGHQEPLAELLDRDRELALLNQMPDRLDQHRWHLPLRPGPLLDALRTLAHRMQWPPAQTRPDGTRANPDPVMGMAEDDLLKLPLVTPRVLHAAEALHLLVREEVDDPVRNGALLITWRWAHQRWLEFLAAYGLTPDAPPEDLSVPPGPDLEQLYQDFLERRGAQRTATPRISNFVDDDEEESHFRLPAAPINAHEEVVAMAVQLRGRAVEWVRLLLARDNAELAARVALENRGAFGEQHDHPQDGWWPEGTEYDGRECLVTVSEGKALAHRRTHRLLNQVRAALLERMNDPAVHISSRIRSGFLLGELGGDRRFAICGQALVLKDEYWQRVPQKGHAVSFELGDLDGREDARTAGDQLLQVDDLPAFEMAGLLTTLAQIRCFIHEGGAPAGTHGTSGPYGIPWAFRRTEEVPKSGSQPATGNFSFALAYALWESAQRQLATDREAQGMVEPYAVGVANQPVWLPTEAQWGAAVRCGQPSGGERWRFGHTRGKPAAEGEDFEDVRPWHFNHDWVFGNVTPVGVFMDSAVGPEGDARQRKLRDLAGNVMEWTVSAHTRQLELAAVLTVDVGDGLTVLMGGCFKSPAADCAAGVRIAHYYGSNNFDDGFRLARLASE